MSIKDIKNSTQIIYYIAKKDIFWKTKKLLDSSDRNNQKKYYGTTSINKKAVSTNTAQLYIKSNINKKTKNIIIDSNIIENFIIKKYTENKKYSI